MNIEDMLLDLGHEVAGLRAASAPHSLGGREPVRRGRCSTVNLAGEPSFPVADLLAERRIPFLFAPATAAPA